MDQNFGKAKEKFEEAAARKDTNKFWKLRSMEVEGAYLRAIAIGNKEAEKKP